MIGALPLVDYAEQRAIDLSPEWFARIEGDVRSAAYRVTVAVRLEVARTVMV